MKIAVVGATGLVGQTFLRLMEERNFAVRHLRLFASQKKSARSLVFRSQEYPVEILKKSCFKGVDIAFFSAGEDISRKWAGEARDSEALVIDNSSAFRMQTGVPLVVPEINPHLITGKKNHQKGQIIANPNCSTIQLALVLHPLHNTFGLDSVHVASYQSLSGAGRKALKQLKNQSLTVLAGTEQASPSLKAEQNPLQWAFNCIPFIGDFKEETGFSTEELKIMRESRKILGGGSFLIAATAVRTPTFNGHGEALSLFLKKPTHNKALTAALSSQKGVKVIGDPKAPLHQSFVDGKDEVYVGRIRCIPETGGRGWMMWVLADNLRKGAALNGLQIAEYSIKNSLL